MIKYVCKHCREAVAKERDFNSDLKMWFHLREEHPKEFKEQESKEIGELFMDNFEKRRCMV